MYIPQKNIRIDTPKNKTNAAVENYNRKSESIEKSVFLAEKKQL